MGGGELSLADYYPYKQVYFLLFVQGRVNTRGAQKLVFALCSEKLAENFRETSTYLWVKHHSVLDKFNRSSAGLRFSTELRFSASYHYGFPQVCGGICNF